MVVDEKPTSIEVKKNEASGTSVNTTSTYIQRQQPQQRKANASVVTVKLQPSMRQTTVGDTESFNTVRAY